MPKIITVSQKFPAYHSKAGQPTYFIEKILNSLYPEKMTADDHLGKKHHTIRLGNRWKTGDMASIRIWSGKPYRSPMIPVAEVKITAFKIKIHATGGVFINERYYTDTCTKMWSKIAANDGLTGEELNEWFRIDEIKEIGEIIEGQIICWNPEIEY